MKTIALNTFSGDWNMLAQELEREGAPVALEISGALHGILLPLQDAQRVVERYAERAVAQTQQSQVAGDYLTTPDVTLLTYLELLRDDPSLVPVVDGQPLEFETMMNSSFVEAEQNYQFRHPRTGEVYAYWASELRHVIGRSFARVEFIPPRPRDVVEGKLKLR